MKKELRVDTFLAPLLFVLMVTGVVVSGAPPDFQIEPQFYKPPVILVRAVKNRDVYDTVDAPDSESSDLQFFVKIRGQCPEKYRLQVAGIEIRAGNKKQYYPLAVNSDHRSIGAGHGAEWELYNFKVPFIMPDTGRSPTDQVFRSPIEACNEELQKAGSEEARIAMLQKGFNIEVAKAYYVAFSVTCEKDGFFDKLTHDFAGSDYPAVVRCVPSRAATQGPPPREGRPVPKPPKPVEGTIVAHDPIGVVEVIPDPVETKGKSCPVYVSFRGHIGGGRNSLYETFNTKYRFVGDHNYQSEWTFIALTRGQAKSVYGRRFIQAPERPRGSFKTPGAADKIPIYSGWMMLEVMTPDGNVRSEKANFSVDCNVDRDRVRARP
jgi:hypothetical protein